MVIIFIEFLFLVSKEALSRLVNLFRELLLNLLILNAILYSLFFVVNYDF